MGFGWAERTGEGGPGTGSGWAVTEVGMNGRTCGDSGEVSLKVEAWATVTDGNGETDLLRFWFGYLTSVYSEASKSGC